MENNITNQNKTTAFLLSEQVKTILQEKGFSALFNYNDYLFFKRRCAKAFNRAQAIAEMFISEANPQVNDFNDYIF